MVVGFFQLVLCCIVCSAQNQTDGGGGGGGGEGGVAVVGGDYLETFNNPYMTHTDDIPCLNESGSAESCNLEYINLAGNLTLNNARSLTLKSVALHGTVKVQQGTLVLDQRETGFGGWETSSTEIYGNLLISNESVVVVAVDNDIADVALLTVHGCAMLGGNLNIFLTNEFIDRETQSTPLIQTNGTGRTYQKLILQFDSLCSTESAFQKVTLLNTSGCEIHSVIPKYARNSLSISFTYDFHGTPCGPVAVLAVGLTVWQLSLLIALGVCLLLGIIICVLSRNTFLRFSIYPFKTHSPEYYMDP